MLYDIAAVLIAIGCLYQEEIDARPAVLAPFNPDCPVSGDLSTDSHICLTPGCVRAASDILNNLDEGADPCDDFYQFACGGWEARHSIPENKGSATVFSEVQNDLNLQLRALLEKKLNGSEPNFIAMVKHLYDSCVDDEAIEAEGSEPLKKVLNSLGGWPVVEGDKWNESNFDWIDVLKALKKLALPSDIIFGLVVKADYRNNKFNSIYLGQPFLGMPDRSYFLRGLNDTPIIAYFKLIVESAKELGADGQQAQEELMEVLEFEIELANLTMAREKYRNVSQVYNRYTVKQLIEIAPQIKWMKYFNCLLPLPIDENQTIIVQAPGYIFGVANLLPNTEKRVVSNYMLWRVAASLFQLLSKDWRDLLQAYSTAITGQSQEGPRWAECLSAVKDNLGIALSSHYVKHYFNDQSKESAVELVQYIRQEFFTILDGTNWMEERTKMRAREKARRVTTTVGYPQELLNNSLVSENYKNLTLTDSYFNNIMRLNRWSKYGDSSDDFRQFIVKGNWKKYAQILSVNAYYNIIENSIVLPAGILRNPFFDKNHPSYLNFGAIGFIIGHELTHGFDDFGRQFDEDGNNANWWDDCTNQHFKEKARCIVEQYGNYTAENGMQINGVNTLGENIADNGGLKEAYWAYQSWLQDHGVEEPSLPGLNYTPNQLFFISAANNYCAKYRPEDLRNRIVTDAHSPSQFRVNGAMSNLPQFSEEFHCEIGTKMNPEQKCNVW